MLNHPHLSTPASTPAHRSRGSVLLLVVVSLVLMVLMGAVYMQVVNIQRQVPPDPPRNIDQVLQSVEQDILQKVGINDLQDSSGNFFNQDIAAADPGNGDEPWDFPWTNHNYTTTYIDPVTGTTYNPRGGKLDDRWLAYTVPVFNAGTGKMQWTQISSLTGVFQVGPGNTADLSQITGGSTTTALPITTAGKQNENLNTDSAALVDADGDGLGDSVWERASLAAQDGVEYFHAVRIIDLASMVNANIALGVSDGSGDFDTDTNRPRSNRPTEVDFNRFANAMTGGTGVTEAQALYELRFGVSPAPIIIPYADRVLYWDEAGSRPGNQVNWNALTGYSPLGIGDELDLRYRNGLVPSGDPFGSSLRAQMPVTYRDASSSETGYNSGTTPYADAKTYYETNPRLYTTTRSAEALWQPRLPGETGNPRVKFGLNDSRFLYNFTTGNPSSQLATALNSLAAGQLLPVITAGATPMPLPAGSSAMPGITGNTTAFVSQWAASLQDFRDRDNRLTTYNGRIGLEALPALTEVYLQRPYQMTSSVPGAAAGTKDITMAAQGEVGYAIEVRNPFRKPVSLVDVRLVFAGIPAVASGSPDLDVTAAKAGGSDLDDLVGDALATHNATAHVDMAPADQRKLYPGDTILLYRLSTGGDAAADDVTALFGGDATTHIPFPLDGSDVDHPDVQWPIAPGGPAETDLSAGLFQVQLRATAQDGTPFAWAYQALDQHALFDNAVYKDVPATQDAVGTPGAYFYHQIDLIGNGNGLNALLTSAGEFTELIGDPFTPGPAATTQWENFDPAIDALGETDKTIVGGPADKVTAGPSQFIVPDHSDERLTHQAELLLVPVFGLPSTGGTFGDAWGPTARPVTDFLVDPSSATVIDAAKPAYNVPHAQLLMNRLTLLDPTTDGIDNDGDGSIDNPGEQTVAGRINLNTIPQPLLDAILPIPDPGIRSGTVASIIARRTNTTPDGARGIAHLWQLYPDLKDAYTTGGYVGDTRVADGTNPVKLDTMSNPESTVGDGIADDREEQLLLIRNLDGIATVRSDVFCAFILVHGYKTGAFNEGPVEIARELIIFSRANVETQGDQPVILARYRYQ